MELSSLINEKKRELQDLKIKLERLQSESGKVKEKFPPIWSGDVKELTKFVSELEKWVRNPQVKRARDLIDQLKRTVKDTRSFIGLGEDYLIKTLDALETAVSLTLRIENESLKTSIVKKILNEIQEEKDIKSLLQIVNNYLNSFRKFEETKVENEFLVSVKEDLMKSLTKIEDFSTTQITIAENTFNKATRAVELLSGSTVSINAYRETYKNLNSVDKVWEYANNIRKLLTISIQCKSEISEPFKEILDLMNERMQCIGKNSLEEIYKCLEENTTKMNKWKDQVKRTLEEESRKVKVLMEFAELKNNIDEILTDLISNLEVFNIDNAYLSYRRLQEIKDEAMKVLEGKISKDERKIIENIQEANELVDEMGDSFWEAIKSLRNKGLIKIIVERGA
ncbi:MAG: hypothetical protein QXR91_08445 [Nitrososphaerales archaeon]